MFVKLAVLVGLLTVAVAFSARTSNGAAPGATYVVRAGDTLWSIAAAHYGGDVREGVWRLQERNGIDGARVRPGQRLVLP
jgi:nucleoid-associated protein YgaU